MERYGAKQEGSYGTQTGDRPIYLRQWVGFAVNVLTVGQGSHKGKLTNIVFDEKRLMYIVLDDKVLLNFDHVVEISLE